MIPIYEAGERDGQLYLAMRYVEGSDLKTVLEREGTLSPERALAILAQVAGALDAAHRRGLVHRDVKPANVLLDEDGHAYLTDFGITKQLGGASTDTGQAGGHARLPRPEQIRGEPVDGRTDGYALACVLYECLAGTPPFRRETEARDAVGAHAGGAAPAARTPHRSTRCFIRALAKDRENRYRTCTEFVDAAAGALGVGAHPLVARRRFRATLLLLLAGFSSACRWRSRSPGAQVTTLRPGSLLDAATNSVAAVDARRSKLAMAVPLPGRPTDVAAGGGTAGPDRRLNGSHGRQRADAVDHPHGSASWKRRRDRPGRRLALGGRRPARRTHPHRNGL